MSFSVHCDFEKGSKNQHFEMYSVGSEGGGHKKGYSVYALDNVARSGRFTSEWNGNVLAVFYAPSRFTAKLHTCAWIYVCLKSQTYITDFTQNVCLFSANGMERRRYHTLNRNDNNSGYWEVVCDMSHTSISSSPTESLYHEYTCTVL